MNTNHNPIPTALKNFFILHFWIDILFAIPLMIIPGLFLEWVGWPYLDPLTVRLVAAALFGIGIESYLGRNKDRTGYLGMLRLKIIWSFMACIGILIGLLTQPVQPIFGFLILGIFIVFNVLWSYWYFQLTRVNNSF